MLMRRNPAHHEGVWDYYILFLRVTKLPSTVSHSQLVSAQERALWSVLTGLGVFASQNNVLENASTNRSGYGHDLIDAGL